MTLALYRGWRTEPTGLIVVTRDDWSEFVPMLLGEPRVAMDGILERWGPICRAEAEKRSLDWRWMAAMIYRESGGDPKAFRREPNGWTGIGLLQLTHPAVKGPHSDEALFDPELNVRVATQHTYGLKKRYGNNFPQICAAYNAGSARPPSPGHENAWNLHCTRGHIDACVSSLNYAVTREIEISEMPPVPLFDLTEVARDADDAARHDSLIPVTKPDSNS